MTRRSGLISMNPARLPFYLRRLLILLAAIFMATYGSGSQAADKPIPSVAFFGFAIINTSLEPTSPAEEARLKMLDDLLREKLEASGRYKLVPIPPALQQEIAAGMDIQKCNGCERDFAKRVGADWAAWGTVQKVSNLILNINLYMENAETGVHEFSKSVDIRGNTNESWQHGLNYMLRHYLFDEP
jgi:hypothetical protein